MIGLLRGQIVESLPDGLIMDVGGVGYEVLVPLGTAGRVDRDHEGRATLHIHTHVREDALVLYGFASRGERNTFRVLLSVSKVGPKLALALLGAVTVEELGRAVASGASNQLAKVPGIGRKTAERIVLELSGKLEVAPTPPAGIPGQRDQTAMLHEALVRMGFKPSEAERAVTEVPDHTRDLGVLIREALTVLAP